ALHHADPGDLCHVSPDRQCEGVSADLPVDQRRTRQPHRGDELLCLPAGVRFQRDRIFQCGHRRDAAARACRQPRRDLDGTAAGGDGMSAPSSRRPTWGRLIAIGVTLIVLLSPFLWLLQMSFKTNELILQFPPPLFFTPTLQHYRALLSSAFSASFVNSLLSASFSTALALLLGVPAAYALSKWKGNSKHALGFAIL